MIWRFPIRRLLAVAIATAGISSFPIFISRAEELDKHELRIRIVDKYNLGVRVQVDLQRDRKSDRVSAFTDWTGTANFLNLPQGNYTVVIATGGKEIYRSQIANDDNRKTKLIHLANIVFTDRQDRISVNSMAASPRAYMDYQTALKKLRSGNLEEALGALNRALAIYPAYSMAHTTRGVILHMQERYADAEDAFRSAIRFDSEALEPHYNLGLLLIQRRRPDAAKVELEKAFALSNDNANVAELLLESLIQTHDEPAAISLAQSLHGRRVLHPASIHLRIAAELTTHGLFELASEQYSFALQDDPSQAEGHEGKTVPDHE